MSHDLIDGWCVTCQTSRTGFLDETRGHTGFIGAVGTADDAALLLDLGCTGRV